MISKVLFPEGALSQAGKEERNAALEQTDRIIQSAHFRNSKRCILMLRYIVLHALEGKVDSLKERTLGIEVFGRAADYDTSSDPVVRITAGEIRKRIALYYQDSKDQQELVVELPVGSYHPEFHNFARPSPAADQDVTAAGKSVSNPVQPRRRLLPGLRGRAWIAAGCATVILASVLFVLWWRFSAPLAPQSGLDAWWGPVLRAQGVTVMCIGGSELGTHLYSMSQESNVTQSGPNGPTVPVVNLSDAAALSHLSSYFGAHGRGFRIRLARRTMFEDLRSGPIILISAFTNDWTMRLTDSLRYHFMIGKTPDTYAIGDHQDPHSYWQIHYDGVSLGVPKDYAIVARYRDSVTDEPVVIVAGLGMNGTVQASELLTNARYFKELSSRLHDNWSQKNIEAVIATQVIDGQSGPPEVLAVYEW